MTRNQVFSQVRNAFGHHQRPQMFIRGTCTCEECMEHEADMQKFDPENLPLDALDNPGWDPICFASNAALAYFMPGLVQLVLDHTEEYVQQFVFHIEQPERLDGLTSEQALALITVLDFLAQHRPDALANNLVVDDLYRTKEKLQRRAAGDAEHHTR